MQNSISKMFFPINARFSKELSILGLSYFVGRSNPSKITHVPILNRLSSTMF